MPVTSTDSVSAANRGRSTNSISNGWPTCGLASTSYLRSIAAAVLPVTTALAMRLSSGDSAGGGVTATPLPDGVAGAGALVTCSSPRPQAARTAASATTASTRDGALGVDFSFMARGLNQ